LQPALQLGDQRFAFRLAHRLPLLGGVATDLRFDPIEGCNPPQRFFSDRR